MRLSYLSAWLSVLILLAFTTPSLALNYNVVNTQDSGAGSLRQAILDANNTPADDTITFSVAANGTIYLQSTLIVANNGTLTITGNGVASTILSGDSDNNGSADVRVLYIDPSATATIQQLTITKGYYNGNGGGIHNRGALTVSYSSLSDNSASSGGGGISSYQGAVVVNYSVINNNSANFGGGILNDQGTVTVNNSIISNNLATSVNVGVGLGVGGGILNDQGTVTINNSTLSGNSGNNGGGGIRNRDIFNLNNSIIANSSSGGDCSSLTGTVNAQYSLIMDDLSCINGTNSNNLTGDPALNVDLTLQASSPAINTGNNSLIPVVVTTDLAGSARIQQGTVDMGAYEFTPTVSFSLASLSVTEGDPMSVILSRNGSTTNALTVSVNLTLGTGTATGDYTLSGGSISAQSGSATITIPAGASSVTLTIVTTDDGFDESDETLTLTLVDDSAYDLGSPNSAIATIIDNDTASVTVNPSSGLITTESGTTASFTVKLSSQPTADVVINLSSGDTSEGTVSPSSLTFTSANWNTEQTVTVTGVDDAVVDGDQPYTIILSAATSSDASYSGFDPSDVSVTNTDDDTATGIPTLSEWALWLLAVLMVGIGARRPARRLHA